MDVGRVAVVGVPGCFGGAGAVGEGDVNLVRLVGYEG